MVKLATSIAALVVLCSTVHADAPCEFRFPYTYTDAAHRKCCIAHHIPLTAVKGFSARDMSTIVDPAEGEENLTYCNPNSLGPYFSLRRTRVISKPCLVTYCKKCEAAIHAWRLKHYPGYKASDSGGSFLKSL